MNVTLEGSHLGKLCAYFGDVIDTVDFSLADGAVHEGKRDALGAPAMADYLSHTVSVEDVSTCKLHARLLSKCAGLADRAYIVFGKLFFFSAFRFEAGQASSFTGTATAGVTTAVLLTTEVERGDRLWLWYYMFTAESKIDVVVVVVIVSVCFHIRVNSFLFVRVLVFSDEIWLWILPYISINRSSYE